MRSHPSLRFIEASDAAARLTEARAWVAARADGPGVLIVSASRGAADDLARAVAAARGGAIGLHRFSLAQLAARLAAPVLAARGIAPVTFIGGEAVAARATFEACETTSSPTSGRWPRTPGFPRALARTLHELLLARVGTAALARACRSAVRISRALLERFDDAVRRRIGDRSRDAVRGGRGGQPTTYRELPLAPARRADRFCRRVRAGAQADRGLARGPRHGAVRRSRQRSGTSKRAGVDPDDARARRAVRPGGAEAVCLRDQPAARARRRPATCVCSRPLAKDASASRSPGASWTKRAAGVPFDEMAVLRAIAARLRRPARARLRARGHPGLVRSRRRPPASVRPRVPGLDRAARSSGCRRRALPNICPSRRCRMAPAAANTNRDGPAAGRRSLLRFHGHRARRRRARCSHRQPNPHRESPEEQEHVPVVDGTLRAPWKWEKLIVESAVDRRRPGSLAPAAARPRAAVSPAVRRKRPREDPDSPRLAAHRARRAQPRAPARLRAAGHRRARLVAGGGDVGRVARPASKRSRRGCCGGRRASCACSASCSRWPRSARSRSKKSRDVLGERLRTLDEQPPANRYGRVFVGSPHQARGAIVPRRVRAGARRADVPAEAARRSAAARRGDARAARRRPARCRTIAPSTERLLLRLAVGAATERLWLSYPRLDVAGARPRVPSFYVLDVMRAITGHIPEHEAAAASGAAPRRGARSTGRRRSGRATRSTTSSTTSRRCAI